MARGANGVTCRECGCLNFSSEHEECDKCRSKTSTSLTFRPTARRSSNSHGGVNTSNNKHFEDSDRRVHSNDKKRRHEESKNTSNKKQEKRVLMPAPPSKKQPDIIDLISDDEDEDVVVQKVLRESLTTRKEEKDENNKSWGLYQSRVFPTVTFKANDFPTMEEGTLMRKKGAEKGRAHSQLSAVTAKNGQVSASQPTPVVSRPVQEKTVDSKPPEPRPSPIVDKEIQANVSSDKKKETEVTNIQDEKKAGSTGVEVEKKETDKVDKEEEDPLFQSRVFDTMEFKGSDFATVFDGLAVARRSHLPTPKSSTASPSCNGAISTVGPTAAPVAAVSKSNEVTGPGKPTTGSSTATLLNTIKTTSPAKAKVSIEPTVPKVSTAATPATMSKHSTTSTSAKEPQHVSKPSTAATAAPTAVTTATTAAATVQSTPAKPKPARMSQPTKASTPAVVVPPTKSTSTSTSSQASSSSAASAKPMASSKSMPVPVSVPKPARASPAFTVKSSSTAETVTKPSTATSAPTSTAGSVASKVSSTPTTNSDEAQTNGSTNVLLPKKRHREGIQRTDEDLRPTKSSHNTVNASSNSHGVEFVKVNAAPHEVLVVEPPILGYCSPEFLAFMRECGGDDGEEEVDPEEVSRSQLKLLHVVDLTNLSDSEESDAESPLPTPRDRSKQQSLPTSGQGSTAVGQSIAPANMNVSGKGTWYVPTLDSDRKRIQPEKVMCELCEEKGIPSRLIRCPTCTKYYHKKCAKENGDENICWNCELGSMIDDTELDEEHAKHNSDYLAYLKAIRRSSSPASGDDDEEVDENSEGENQEGEDGAGAEGVEMAIPVEGKEDTNAFTEGSNTHSKRWKEFIGEATADIDADYHKVTNRIAEELRDEEKRRVYSRGFVSREEFEAQMTEVEEYYISEEARLQQLEREKALEAKKAAEARKAQTAAEQAVTGELPGGSSASENNAASVLTPAVQNGGNTGVAATEVPPSRATPIKTSPTSAIVPPASAIVPPASAIVPPASANVPPASALNTSSGGAPNAPETASTIPMKAPTPVHSMSSQAAIPLVMPTTIPVPGLLSTMFRAAFSKPSQPPPSKP